MNTKNKFIKNYEFDAFYQGTDCRVVMTALLGHLMDIDFEPSFKSWKVNTLEQLFNARLVQTVPTALAITYLMPLLKLGQGRHEGSGIKS